MKNAFITTFKNLKHTWKGAIAPTIVAALIFLLTYYVFGVENSMIAPFATLSYMRFRSMRSNHGCIFKNFMIYLAMAGLAYLAVINLPLCILINAAALFWIAYLLIDEYNPTNYFPAGMALIFFQIAPIRGLPALLTRVEALCASFVIIVLFVYLPMLVKGVPTAADKIRPLVEEGFSLCRELLGSIEEAPETTPDRSGLRADRRPNAKASEGRFENTEALSETFFKTPRNAESKNITLPGKKPAKSRSAVSALHDRLAEINHRISMEIYSYNRSSIRHKGKVNWYCQFVMFFQLFNYLTEYYKENENLERAGSMYREFLDIYNTETPASDYKHLHFRVNRLDIRDFRLRFAIRMMIVVTPCLIFAWASGLENVYWLVISVFFMMIPFSNETMNRVRQRVGGTLCGLVICFVLFSIFPGLTARMIVMSIANFFIYSASGYGATVAYITCSALAVQTVNTAVLAALGERLFYTLAGAVIAIAANRFILRVRSCKQIEYLFVILKRIRWNLVRLDNPLAGNSTAASQRDPQILVSLGILRKIKAGTLSPECRRHQTDQLIIKSYLLTSRIRELNASMPEEQQVDDLKARIKEHMSFMAVYLSNYRSVLNTDKTTR